MRFLEGYLELGPTKVISMEIGLVVEGVNGGTVATFWFHSQSSCLPFDWFHDVLGDTPSFSVFSIDTLHV